MKAYSINLILVTLLVTSGCGIKNPFDCTQSDTEIIHSFGAPYVKEIILTDSPSLYEYQNGLMGIYKNIQKGDTIRVIEKGWEKDHYRMVRWYNNKDTTKPIDCLTWNSEQVKY